MPCRSKRMYRHALGCMKPTLFETKSDVPRSLQSWVSTIQTVVLTADVFQLFIKTTLRKRLTKTPVSWPINDCRSFSGLPVDVDTFSPLAPSAGINPEQMYIKYICHPRPLFVVVRMIMCDFRGAAAWGIIGWHNFEAFSWDQPVAVDCHFFCPRAI